MRASFAIGTLAPVTRLVFSTSFPATENPISQGGIWIARDPNQTKIQTVSGSGAFGTGAGISPNVFDDSQANIAGFGNDYEIEAVVFKLSGGANWRFQEVELLCRWTDNLPQIPTSFGPSTSNGYEWNVAYNGEYQNVGRWKFAAIDSTAPDFVPADGDLMRMRVQGQRIQCFWNNVQKIDVTDNDPTLKITTGNPGMGMYISPDGAGGTPANTNFGFKSIKITPL